MKIRDLVLAAATLAWAGGACAEVTPCRAHLDIADQDPAGLNVRASPGGPVIAKVKAQGRWVEVDATGQAAGPSGAAWARIAEARMEADENDQTTDQRLWKGVGWVAFSKLEVSEFDSRARFHAEPNARSKVVLSLENIIDAAVNADALLGCDGDWLKVRIKGIVGWTDTWCTNQLTTCV
jgi:hypothetical protein